MNDETGNQRGTDLFKALQEATGKDYTDPVFDFDLINNALVSDEEHHFRQGLDEDDKGHLHRFLRERRSIIEREPATWERPILYSYDRVMDHYASLPSIEIELYLSSVLSQQALDVRERNKEVHPEVVLSNYHRTMLQRRLDVTRSPDFIRDLIEAEIAERRPEQAERHSCRKIKVLSSLADVRRIFDAMEAAKIISARRGTGAQDTFASHLFTDTKAAPGAKNSFISAVTTGRSRRPEYAEFVRLLTDHLQPADIEDLIHHLQSNQGKDY